LTCLRIELIALSKNLDNSESRAFSRKIGSVLSADHTFKVDLGRFE